MSGWVSAETRTTENCAKQKRDIIGKEISMVFLFVLFVLFILSLFVDWSKAPGLLYLLAIPLAIITFPIRLALDVLGWRRR